MTHQNKKKQTSPNESNQPKERYYIGYHKPEPEISMQKPDPYEYERWQASRRLKLPEWELADEPDADNRLDNIDEGT